MRFDGGPAFNPVEWMRPDPWPDQSYDPHYLISREQGAALAKIVNREIDPSRGFVSVQPFDCTRSSARGVSVEFWRRDEEGSPACTDCELLYPDDHGFWDETLTEFTYQGHVPAIGFALGAITVVARDTETQQPVAVFRTGLFKPDHAHGLRLFPASKQDLGALPASIRRP